MLAEWTGDASSTSQMNAAHTLELIIVYYFAIIEAITQAHLHKLAHI